MLQRTIDILEATAIAALVVVCIACFNRPRQSAEVSTILMLTGDVMLGRGIDQILRHSVDPVIYESYMRSATGYVRIAEEKSGPIPRKVPPDYVWGDALAMLRRVNPRVRIINLETAVTTSDEPWPGKGIQYRMHPANVDVLTAARIDCAVLANNHVLDWGRDGLRETIESLRKARVKIAGAGADFAQASAPVIFEVPDGRVLVFAMAHESSGVPPAWGALPARSGVHLLPDLSRQSALRVAQQIKNEPRKAGDRVVVSIHWGGNWGYEIPAEQERFAKVLIDEGGVDVVHGHSSHHPRRIEVYRGRLILYGAGDLINDYEGIGGYEEFRTELSLIYLPALSNSGAFESMFLVPMRLERFRLNRAKPEETEWLRRLLERESRGVQFEVTDDGLIAARPKP
ncbi:MAG TPA: CapA family protein [Thermoanaerobaculia bacterium]|jgi:poly-gamma-glutamate synthesis protein (capsule biosynthesis protein)|nr:CapA family protein [Thermoanaerobaculia bacterium]